MDQCSSRSTVISLIIATVGRVEELDCMLASVAAQRFENVEVIIVDQNSDDRVNRVLKRWSASLSCSQVRSTRGLSRARNLGLQLASGDIVGFPDDDCWYPEDLLLRVREWFDQHHDYDFLCCI